MIQRIQTVYLFVAAAAIVAMFFFPVASFFGDTYYFNLKLSSISDDTYVAINTIPLIVMAAILIVMIFSCIFAFRNRLLQIKLIRFTVLLNLAFIIIIYFGYIDNIVKKANVEVQYQTGVYFPLIALIFLILAMRGVMNDEKKVRAADRLR
jgi:hypothetical protein